MFFLNDPATTEIYPLALHDALPSCGACDAKSIIAAQITAAERLRAEGVGEIGLLFVVDEEMGSAGARAANAHPRARECRWLIDGEPTDNKLAAGSNGSLRLSLRTDGVTAHSRSEERRVGKECRSRWAPY